MKNPFTFEAEPLPAAALGEIGGPEAEFETDRFLGWLGNLSGESRIVDRTAFTPKDRRKGVRDIKKVYALVLHQMAFSRGSDSTRYDTVTAHFAILSNGTILQLHPLTAYLWASDGFNHGSVAVEFAGNFPNTKGKCWEAKTYGCHKVTPEQIEAGRYLVKYLIDTIGLTHILAHRQSRDTRENDPGPDIWYHVGQWAIEQYGLKDGGPAFKVGSGKPIPDEWRNWGRISTGFSLESLDELGGEDWFGEVEPEFSSSIEAVLVRSAIRGGTTDENRLTDLIFFRRHPERNGRPISRFEPNAQQLGREWLDIRDRLVRPALADSVPAPTAASSPTPSPIDRLPVSGMEKTSSAFQNKVIRIAKGLGTDPNYLMAIMSFESGFDPAARNPYSGATGLIQFMPKTAKGLGTTTEALARMSAEQQLDCLAAYFAPYRGRLKTLEDAYMAVLWPEAIGKGSDFVLFASPSTAYTQNQVLDTNKDGRVTVAEAASFVRKRFRSTAGDLQATFASQPALATDLEVEAGLGGLSSSVGGASPSAIESAMVRSAIRSGTTSENQLTDLIFFHRHPERGGQTISRSEPDFQQLSQEWIGIRDTVVRPILLQPKPPASSPPSLSTSFITIRSGVKLTPDIEKVVRALDGHFGAAGLRVTLTSGYRSPQDQLAIITREAINAGSIESIRQSKRRASTTRRAGWARGTSSCTSTGSW